MPRIPIRPFFAALVMSALASAALAWSGIDPVLAAQPDPRPQAQPVTAALAPQMTPRVLATPASYLAPPRALRRPHKVGRQHRSRWSGSPRSIGRQLAAARGWTGRQWTCLDNLWTRESEWKVHNRNVSSGAYGIPQSLPADKMSSAGSDWRDNAVTQVRWGLSYISVTYGTPCGAWEHSQNYNYY